MRCCVCCLPMIVHFFFFFFFLFFIASAVGTLGGIESPQLAASEPAQPGSRARNIAAPCSSRARALLCLPQSLPSCAPHGCHTATHWAALLPAAEPCTALQSLPSTAEPMQHYHNKCCFERARLHCRAEYRACTLACIAPAMARALPLPGFDACPGTRRNRSEPRPVRACRAREGWARPLAATLATMPYMYYRSRQHHHCDNSKCMHMTRLSHCARDNTY